MSQNELAEKAGICRPYLSQIETHRQKVVGSEVMFNLAKALGVKYEEIFTLIVLYTEQLQKRR